MGSNAPATYTPYGNSAISMTLPDHCDGIIDIRTLQDIHNALCESIAEDDLVLAAWIKSNYLYDLTQAGLPIRTTEGFSKLDRAYRRVRSLTNKAQDKWPFFDQKWKTMSSTTVRNNARGEAAPGVTMPGMNSGARNSAMTNGHRTQTDETSATSASFASFGDRQHNRHKAQPRHQSFPRPVPNTPVPLPPTKKGRSKQGAAPNTEKLPAQSGANPSQDLPGYGVFFPQSDGQSNTPSESGNMQGPDGGRASTDEVVENSIESTGAQDAPSESNATDQLQDAGAGKVRGPGGRFFPKKVTPSQSAKSRRSSASARPLLAKKARSSENSMVDSEMSEAASPFSIQENGNDDTMADVQSSPAPEPATHAQQGNQDDYGPYFGLNARSMLTEEDPEAELMPAREPAASSSTTRDKINVLNGYAMSESTGDIPIADMANSVLSGEYLLAADSDPVVSNLDKLPPYSRKPKRKSEPAVQQWPRKRGPGRPRKSEQRRLAAEQEAQTGLTDELGETGAAAEEQPTQMRTRQSRRSAAAAKPDPPTPAASTSTVPTPRETEQLVNDQDETMVDDDDKDTTVGQEVATPAPRASKLATPLATRKTKRSTAKAKSQAALVVDSEADAEDDEDALLELGLDKTSGSSKRKAPQEPIEQPQVEEAQKDFENGLMEDVTTKSTAAATGSLDAKPNGTSKSAPEQVATPAMKAPEESAVAPSPEATNGTAPIALANGFIAPRMPENVEFIARVRTATGGVEECPVALDNLSDDLVLVQRYAAWMSDKKMQIPFEAFKSILGMAQST